MLYYYYNGMLLYAQCSSFSIYSQPRDSCWKKLTFKKNQLKQIAGYLIPGAYDVVHGSFMDSTIGFLILFLISFFPLHISRYLKPLQSLLKCLWSLPRISISYSPKIKQNEWKNLSFFTNKHICGWCGLYLWIKNKSLEVVKCKVTLKRNID